MEVQLDQPDMNARKEILELYMKSVKIGKDVDVDKLAKVTYGARGGAELENLVNQAALEAGINGSSDVTMKHMEFAIKKHMLGGFNLCLVGLTYARFHQL